MDICICSIFADEIGFLFKHLLRELGEFAQVGQMILRNGKILGVLCAEREPFEQKVFGFVQVLWIERAHRITQTQTTGSHTELETVSKGINRLSPWRKLLHRTGEPQLQARIL